MKLAIGTASCVLLATISCKPREFNEGSQTLATIDPSQCIFLGDEFEPRGKFPQDTEKGKRGACFDTVKARPAKIMTATQAEAYNVGTRANSIATANISHNGFFYMARIPTAPGDVTRVIFQEESFPAPIPAAHGQIRIDFKEPISLIPQIPGKGKPYQTKYLVLSAEAIGEPNDQFDLIKGVQNAFGNVWRVKTLSQFAIRMSATDPQHVVRQFELSLDQYPEERAAILKTWIEHSDKMQLSKMYHTIASSCAMEALNIIGRVRHANPGIESREIEAKRSFLQKLSDNAERTGKQILFWLDNRIATPFEIYPTFIEQALKSRFLFKREIDTLNKDPIYQRLLEGKE